MKKRDKRTMFLGNLPGSGRIGRIAKLMVAEIGLSKAERVMRGAEKFKEFSYPAKANYMRGMIQRLKKIAGTTATNKILTSCGMMCCGVTHRKLAKHLMQKSRSLGDFIRKLNEKHVGGGRLRLQNKHTITGGYDRCYCGSVSKTGTRFPDLTYCQCSTGWYKQLFETALERPVQVTILQSIISGARTCEFVIKI